MGSRGFWRASRFLLLVGAFAWSAPAVATHYDADEGEDLMRSFAFEEDNLAEFARHRSSPAAFYRSNKVRREERRKGVGERKGDRDARGAPLLSPLPPRGSRGEWEAARSRCSSEVLVTVWKEAALLPVAIGVAIGVAIVSLARAKQLKRSVCCADARSLAGLVWTTLLSAVYTVG